MSLARPAHAFGLAVVVGSNGELGVGAAAQLHAACAATALSPTIPSDIIGAHYYEQDVLTHLLDIDGVTARLCDAPGLGAGVTDAIAATFVSVRTKR